MSQWAHYADPEPEWEAEFEKLKADLPPPLASVAEIPVIREGLTIYSKQILETADYPRGGLTVTEHGVPVEGEAIPVRVYVPEADVSRAGETFPLLVDLRGGGYVFGSLDTDEIKCRKICVSHRVVVVNVNYRLAPEHPWPIGMNDSYAAVKWAAMHSRDFGADINKGFIICGLSAGAAFTQVITNRARNDEDLKGKLTGQILQIPSVLGCGSGYKPERYKNLLLSFEQNKDPLLTPESVKVYIDAYKPGPGDHPDCSPMLCETLSGLPPAYFQIAGADILRDEGLLYAQVLSEAGVPTKVDVYPGVPHGFHNYLPGIKASQKWHSDFDEGIKWLLNFSPGTK